jgi:hypothetical protein
VAATTGIGNAIVGFEIETSKACAVPIAITP